MFLREPLSRLSRLGSVVAVLARWRAQVSVMPFLCVLRAFIVVVWVCLWRLGLSSLRGNPPGPRRPPTGPCGAPCGPSVKPSVGGRCKGPWQSMIIALSPHSACVL